MTLHLTSTTKKGKLEDNMIWQETYSVRTSSPIISIPASAEARMSVVSFSISECDSVCDH